MKASLPDSGVIPTGWSVIFFKLLEFMEKPFSVIPIGMIVIIEVKKREK